MDYINRHTKHLILLLFLFCASSFTIVNAQEWNTARLSVLYGGNIPVDFNNLSRIKKGIEFQTGTRFGISMADSSVVGHQLQGFTLYCRAFNNQANIKGEVYTLPLIKSE